VPGPILEHDLLIAVQENTHVALARRIAIDAAKAAKMSESDAGAVGIVVTEAATNLLKHGGGGEIVVRTCRDCACTLEILALDRGRGMVNPARCMEDGYSTAGSPGTGLGAIHRLAQHNDIYSVRDLGTVLLARLGRDSPPPAPSSSFLVGSICVPVAGEDVSGDAWIFQTSGDTCRLVVADGLGHGRGAAEASQAAIQTARENTSASPVAFIDIAHARLRPTRGAALAIAQILLGEKRVAFSGTGNISGFLVSQSEPRRQMVSMNGTAGHEIRTAQEFYYPWQPGSLLILHSDGIKTHWAIDRYPGLFDRSPSIIASVLFRDFRRGRDDATVVVVRQRDGIR
jgi:anti-sigma regulatory factor (Ser/Thr protein kinase)